MSIELGGNPPMRVDMPDSTPVVLAQPSVTAEPVMLVGPSTPQALTPGAVSADGVSVVPVAGAPATSEPVRIVRDGIAAHDLSGHRVVTLDGALLRYASAEDMADVQAPLWVTLGSALQGQPAAVVAYGPLEEPSWSWTPGPVYLGVDGALTQTEPTPPGVAFVAVVGYATSATELVVDRSPSIVFASGG